MDQAKDPFEENLKLCRDLVRTEAQDTYLANLLLDPSLERKLLPLQAFHVELSRAVQSVHEPMAGEIRLQWWRDVLGGEREGEARGNPYAAALIDLINAEKLDTQPLLAKIDAHVFELYREPMGDRGMFEGWCGETRSTILYMSAQLSGSDSGSLLADIAGHAGVALGTLAVMQNLGAARARGQCHIPEEILAAAGMNCEQFNSEWSERNELIVASFVDFGLEHLEKAETSLSEVSGKHNVTFLPLTLARHYFNYRRKTLSEAHLQPVRLSQLRRQWILWRASRKPPYASM